MGGNEKSGRPKKGNRMEMPQKLLLLRINSKDIDLSQIHGGLMRKAHEGESEKNGYVNRLLEVYKQKTLEYEQKMREYSIAESPFKCTLNKAQLKLLLTFFNEHLLEGDITIEGLEEIFMGKDKGVTYRLKNWDLFILLFKGLSGDGFDESDANTISYLTKCFKPIEGHQYISNYWQKSVEESKVFADKKGTLLTAGKIRRRLSKIRNVLPEGHIPVDVLEQLFEQIVTLEG